MNMAARLPYLDREQVPPDVQAVYDKMKKATGRVLNTFRLMAHHARSVAPFVGWYGTLREGALDLKLRQLAYVKASQINGCNY
jgi:alkylhydroperoxidase family enzyme